LKPFYEVDVLQPLGDDAHCKQTKTHPLMKKLLFALSITCAISATEPTTAYERLNLPNMGEPADQVMSPRQEKALGRGFMRQIRQHLKLVDDTELNEFVQRTGEQLLAARYDINPADFTFFVVENPAINAFAIPGGFIGINSGLIMAANNEAQVASVMAHEIAHVLQRHIARLYASQGNSNFKAAATILAAILLSQQSPEAGQAALLTGLAASQQSAINFTRTHEYEADRIGIQLLSDAGYNPRSMVDFFEVLRRRTSLSGPEQLEFLRTHPLTSNRISEARNNAARLSNPTGVQDSVEFQLQQMKLKVLHSTDPRGLARALESGHISKSESARLYGRIILHLNAGEAEQTQALIARLLKLQPGSTAAKLLAARVAQESGNAARAERLYGEIIDYQPDSYAATEKYLDLLSIQGRADRAERVIKSYLRNSSRPAPGVFRKYASVLRLKGQTVAAHEAMADYFLLLDEDNEAVAQLEIALRSAEQDSNEESRIAARILETRKRLRGAF
jgi:predicted Zn-dependent protease